MKAAIYARVSTADKGQEVENQLSQLREFAAKQGWKTVEYVDHESGGHGQRPCFRAMFEAAARREFDLVLFWALDRFTREGSLPTLQYLNQLSSYGVGYRSFMESYLDTVGIFKDAIIAILGALAQQERLRTVERVRVGLARARQFGTKSGKAIGRPRAVFDREALKQLRAENLSNGEMARRLGISPATVKRELGKLVVDQNPPPSSGLAGAHSAGFSPLV